MPIPDLISPSNFEFFARFLLAGFIIFSVRNRYVLGERPKPGEIVFEAVVLSLINQLVFIVLSATAAGVSPFVFSGRIESVFQSYEKLSFFLEVLVLPAILGVIFGYNLQGGWNTALLRGLAMPVVHPTRRAYDFAFGSGCEESFLIVKFQDGATVYGFFGQDSLAASDTNRSDLYLESLYDVDEQGQWAESQPARSALISLEDIRSIEFLPIPPEDENAT